MNGKVRFEGEVAGCLHQIEPYYYVYYMLCTFLLKHLGSQFWKFYSGKIENMWYYIYGIIYCIVLYTL